MSKYTLAQLHTAHEYLAEMVADRPDGEVYLPVFLKIEAEILAHSEKESALDRARRIAQAMS